jgi:hypothetical protein
LLKILPHLRKDAAEAAIQLSAVASTSPAAREVLGPRILAIKELLGSSTALKLACCQNRPEIRRFAGNWPEHPLTPMIFLTQISDLA